MPTAKKLTEAAKRKQARAMRERGCGLKTIQVQLKVRRKWLLETLGLPPDAPPERRAAPSFDDVPSLPGEVARLLSQGLEPTTAEAKAGMAAHIEAACAVLRKRQQVSPPREKPGDGKRFALVMGKERGGTISL